MIGPAVLTYRYIRLLLIAAVLAILVAVALAWIDEGELRASVSTYFYSPAGGVFTGSLFAIGLALVGLRGRQGAEDIILNVAGLLAPIVAVVPTPVCPDGPPYGLQTCLDEAVIPEPYVAGAVTGSLTLAIVVGIGLTYMTFVLRRRFAEREVAVGILLLWAIYVPGVAGAVVFPEAYLLTAHYVTAVGLFVCITVVALLSARRSGRDRDRPAPGMSHLAYRRWYRIVAATMVLTIVTGGVLLSGGVPGQWLLATEVILMVVFAVYWGLQTAEHWRTGLPPEPESTTLTESPPSAPA